MVNTKSKTTPFSRELEAERIYWMEALSGELGESNLRLDFERPATYSAKKETVEVSLPETLTRRLSKVTGDSPFLLYTALMAALKVCLYKHGAGNPIVIGSPLYRVNGNGVQGDNVLALADHVDPQTPFRDFLLKVRESLIEGYARPNYPFARLVRDLKIERGENRSPLFDIALVLENIHRELPELRNDITLRFLKSEEKLDGIIAYNGDLFRRETIERFAANFVTLLASAFEKLDRPIRDLESVSGAERRQLTVEWNRTETEFANDKCVHQLFEARAQSSPAAVAVEFNGERLTYGELNRRANRLAHHLRKRGVGPEVIVAVCVERSIEMVVALLGVLKAGGAYLPLDTAYPPERLAFMLEDARAFALLTTRLLTGNLPEHKSKLVLLDEDREEIEKQSSENPFVRVMPENLAYLIYTSGSTGRPKGVLAQHRGLCNLVEAQIRAFDINASSRILQFAAFSFDASVSEFFTALSAGATLCLGERTELASPRELTGLLKKLSISVVTLPPTLLTLLGTDELPSVQTLVAAGEHCPPNLIAKWSGRRTFINAYGPTEGTVCATLLHTDALKPGESSIGRPIANTEIYILDDDGQVVPIGVAGELHIAGIGLARGYLHHPALTAEKFIPHPFSTRGGERMYRTGDIGRYRADGTIEYIGRADEQVKVRGYRIELGEIEHALRQHSQVRDCVVIAQGDGQEKRLVAYLVAAHTGEELQVEAVRSYLREKLPEYMIPSVMTVLEEIPLSPNGKVNRKALPDPEMTRPTFEHEFEGARTPTEEILLAIWQDVLKVSPIGIHDNFFELGGHSLLATQVFSRLREVFGVELPLRTLFESPRVSDLALHLDAARQSAAGGSLSLSLQPITARVKGESEGESEGEPLPLSFAQQRLWFLDQLEPGSPFYNVPTAVRLSGRLDHHALERTLSEVVRRHEVLRTTFATIAGLPRQVVHAAATVVLPLVDLSELEEERREATVRRLAVEEARRGFDLSRGPLLRALVLRVSKQEHVALLTMHHIVSDGWSMGLLIREVSLIYDRYSRGEEAGLEELAVQYGDYARWQREWLTDEVLEEQIAYWKRLLEGAAQLELPTDRVRPAVQSYRGAHRSFRLAESLTAGLRRVSEESSATLFMTLLGGFALLLSRYSGQTDIVVGTDIAGRNRRETEEMIGFFVNQLVLRVGVRGSESFRELLERVREICLGGYAHQDVPFERVVEELQPERTLNRAPLFQVKLILQNTPMPQRLKLSGLELSGGGSEMATTKLDLLIAVTEVEGELKVLVEYSTDLFEESRIERMVGHYEQLLASIVEDPQARVGQLQMLGEEERQQLLYEFNQTTTDYPSSASIHELFTWQARRTPDAPALLFEGHTLSYKELDARSNQLAHYLRDCGVGAESLVGVLLPRSLEMVISLLAVLKAGGAYVPLDPTYPLERLSLMMEDAGLAVLLTKGGMERESPGFWGRTVLLDELWDEISSYSTDELETKVEPENVAYVIYTSGSTGAPKGVMVCQKALAVRTLGLIGSYGLRKDDRLLQFVSPSFDAFGEELFPILSVGASLVLGRHDAVSTSRDLLSAVEELGITLLHVPVAPWQQLVDELYAMRQPMPEVLRLFITGGESPSARKLERWSELNGGRSRFISAYGPTEATITSAIYEAPEFYTDAQGELTRVPIGKPVANTEIYILDDDGQVVPIGVSGEIHIAGIGLARGYLHHPALTAEKFIPHPFSTRGGERMYRTGDIGRYRADGTIEYIGRADEQVKVRGYRIELGEIEHVLKQHREVRDCVVMAQGDGQEKRLVAYLVAEAGEGLQVEAVRSYLREKLPEYMIPAVMMVLEEMPLSANGKVDRKALPVIEQVGASEAGEFTPPATELEEMIARVWGTALNLEKVDVNENFFEMGGHSLLAAQVYAQLREQVGREFQLIALFEYPTVRSLAAFLSEEEPQPAPDEEADAKGESRRAMLNRQRQARNVHRETSNV